MPHTKGSNHARLADALLKALPPEIKRVRTMDIAPVDEVVGTALVLAFEGRRWFIKIDYSEPPTEDGR